MQTIATNDPVVCCVGLSVYHTSAHCKNGCTDRGPDRGVDPCRPKKRVLNRGPNSSPHRYDAALAKSTCDQLTNAADKNNKQTYSTDDRYG